MKKLILAFIAILLAASIVGCSSSSSATVQVIDADKAKELLALSDTVLVDVRTQEEYDQGHIEKAILIPYNEIEASASQYLPNKQAAVIVYCRTGQRASWAAATLLAAGYQQVYNLGGINKWPDPLVTE